VDQASRRSFGGDSTKQRLGDEILRHTFSHGVAHDFSSKEVFVPSKVQPAFSRGEWSKKRRSASPPRTVRAPFSAYGSPSKRGPWPLQHHDTVK